MIKTRLSRFVFVGTIIAALAAVIPAYSDTTFGVRTGVYTDAEAGFLGGEVLTSLPSHWYFNPNLEVALTDTRNVVSANGDFHYDFLQDRPYYVWAGGGPALIRHQNNVEPDETDFGVNVLGGIAWKTSSRISPYLQGKVTLTEEDEAVLAFGLRF